MHIKRVFYFYFILFYYILFFSWNEWLTLPIKYCDLPSTAQFAITVWDTIGPRKVKPVGGTTLRLFGKQWYTYN